MLRTKCDWIADEDGPSADVELTANDVLSIRTDSIGKLSLDGDVELVPSAEPGSAIQVRWKSTAREALKGSGSVTISHPNDDFNDVEISLEMEAVSSLSVDAEEAKTPPAPMTSNDAVNRYGAYACCVVAALGALLFALIMPAHRSELISGAAGIGIWGYFATSEYDRFGWRILGFIAAGVTMCFALAMPGNTDQLIEGAGVLCALAIYFGDN